MADVEMRLQGRVATYFTILSIVLGLLVATLMVPLVFGDTGATVASGDGTERRSSELGAGTNGGSAPGSASDGQAVTEVPGEGGVGLGGGSTGGAHLSEPAPGVDGSEPAPGVDGGGQGARGASDRGVTAEEIKLGLLLFDVGGASDFGFNFPGVDPESQRKAWQAYVDQINASGGLAGRTIVPVYEKYDVLSPDSMRAACLRLTQDHKVFAVIDQGGIAGPAVLCFTEENDTLFLNLSGFGLPQNIYARSESLLFTLFPSGERSLQMFAAELHRLGELPGKTIGILADDFPDNVQTVTDGFVRTIEKLGYRVARRENLSSDLATGASQIPLALQNMKSAGVDAVVLLTQSLYATQFVQQGADQGFVPAYYVGDWWGGYSDTFAQNMPEAFDGALAVTTSRNGEHRVGLPEPAPERRCREIFEQETGEKLPRGSLEYFSNVRACAQLQVLAAGVSAAGINPTRAATSAGIQRLGTVALAHFGGGSFAPGKFDAADLVRATEWHFDCKCYVPINDFIRPAGP